MKKEEEKIHAAICKYLKYQYKDIYFLSDPSGVRMNIGQAVKLKKTRSIHSQLDIVVLHPNKSYKGLVMEVKKGKSEVYTKQGEFRNTEHVKNQNKSIELLNKLGYYATYVFSFDHGKMIVDQYLNDK